MLIFMVFSEITFLTESIFVEILSSVLDLNISYILVMCELHVKSVAIEVRFLFQVKEFVHISHRKLHTKL